MTIQIASWQRAAVFPQRGHRRPGVGRCTPPLRSYDPNVEVRQALSLPLPGADEGPAPILVVDDTYTTGPLVYHLHGLGYWSTRVASSGGTALELARDSLPSVVLLALELPDMSAYGVAMQLRDEAAGRQLRIIALTSDYAHTDRDQARQAGFERYLAKPVSVWALHQLLHLKH